MPYFPPQHPEWERREPEMSGLDPAAIAAASRHAAEHETPWSRDLAVEVLRQFDEEPPWNEALGPVRPRGGPNGLVLHRGRIVAEWGDTGQVDMTFSVAKSYLSILAGLAWDRRLIRDLDEPVCRTVDDVAADPGLEGRLDDGLAEQVVLQRLEVADALGEEVAGPLHPGQIGRASCRERV